MTKKLMTLAMLLVVACAAVWASDTKSGMTENPALEAMKAGMMKCAVCKNFAAHMDEIGQVGMEAVKLNDGVVIRHWAVSTDPKRIAAFHAACEGCAKAGEACATMTDEQAKTDLCEFCQGIRSAMKSGAKMSKGSTANGDLMVLTSADPAVQGQLFGIHEKCVMMMAMMEAPASKTSAEK